MQLLGRTISKWWCIAVIPALVFISPALLMGFFFANDLAGAIVGPPAIWNRPWQTPSHTDLVGKYAETKPRTLNQIELGTAKLELAADGTMAVRNLPYDFVQTSCALSGKGTWDGPDSDGKISLNLISDGFSGSCESSSYSFLELAGHSKPYKLYWVVGDPDSGTGVWLKYEK